MWCWWSTYLIFLTWKRDCFVKWNYRMLKKKICGKKQSDYHMLGLLKIKMFTSPNLETQRCWDVGACSKRHFTDFIRVLSLLSKSWNMNSCTHLFVCFAVDVGCTDQVHFGGVSIKEGPEGQRSFWLPILHMERHFPNIKTLYCPAKTYHTFYISYNKLVF